MTNVTRVTNVTNMTNVTPWDPVGLPLDRGQQINEYKNKISKGDS